MDIKQIILRSIYHKLSEAEEEALQEWLKEDTHQTTYKRIRQNLTERDALEFLGNTQTEAALRRVKNRLRRPLRRIAAATSAAAAVILGIVLWHEEPESLEALQVVKLEQDSLSPTITLASGEILYLNDSSANYNSSTTHINISGNQIQVIAKDTVHSTPLQTIHYNTLNVPRGKNYALTLPDGTRVWVNALSQLKFPSSFSGNAQRQVELKGEGYFEVARDTAHPFEVKTAQQTIIVTGTSFNISAYEDEINRTTLCSGKVTVETPQGEQIPLSPGQQLATDLTGKAEITEVDTDIYTAWLKGVYYFDEKTLTEVFKELSKWFDISEVNYIDPALEERLFSGKLKKADGLEVILQVIEQGSRSKITNDEGHLKIEVK